MNIQVSFMCLRSNFFSIIALVLFASCANIVTPQGGDKDVVAPYAKSAIPNDSFINFKANKITINFTENIQLKEPEKNITISPSLKKSDFVIESDKNKLVIKLKNLKPSTTYTIKAINSIADLTESNTLPFFKYVFSTGQYLDSLSIRGRVINAMTLQKLNNVQVGLYRNFSDSDIINKEPDYITFTDNQGLFTFDNISPGYYKVISIEDKNSDRLWNIGEGIAFERDTLLVADTQNTINLRMVYFNPAYNHLVSSLSTAEGIYQFEFDSLYESIIINQEDKYSDKREPWYQKIYNNNCNSQTTKIHLFSKNNPLDSAHFNYKIRETIYRVAIKTSNTKSIFTANKTDYLITELDEPRISFNKIIDPGSIRQGRIKLVSENSTSILSAIRSDSNGNIILPKLKAGGYKIVIPQGTFYDLLGVENDSSSINIKVSSKDETQLLHIKPDSSINDSYTLRLESSNGFCKEYNLKSLTDIEVSNLIPDKYTITIYNSLPKHSLLSNSEGYHVVYYKEIEIKKGFDLEEQVYLLYP